MTTPPELRALLADSLALWGEAGRVAVEGDGAVVTLPGGLALRVRPAAPAEQPIRWWLERPGQRRPCTSVLGLLRGVRNACGGAAGGKRLRVVAGPGA